MPTRLSVFGKPIPESAIEGRRLLPVAVAMVAGLSAFEYAVEFDFSLGVLYTIPVLIAAAALTRGQLVVFGLFAALARAPFTPAASWLEFVLKFAMASIAYVGSGLLIVEMSNSRRRLIEAFARLQQEQSLRQQAEAQWRILAESSPAAILTMDADTVVVASNRAAQQMLAAETPLTGRQLADCFPMFAHALQVGTADRVIRTSVSGWARRLDGQPFPVQAWFSVYGEPGTRGLAAIAVDMSEEVRDREREHFQHLLNYNRLLASAVSHEIRNLCAAIIVAASNLSARHELRSVPDLDALVQLVRGLKELASLELASTRAGGEHSTDVATVIDQLRVVVEPDWEEIGGRVTWEVPVGLPKVAADAHGLLQIFLNLCQNSLRAVSKGGSPWLTVSVQTQDEDVVVTVTDAGPGIASPDRLFQLHPPDSASEGSGLGLYISRALARSFGGELAYVSQGEGTRFQVVIPAAGDSTTRRQGAA